MLLPEDYLVGFVRFSVTVVRGFRAVTDLEIN